MADEKKDAVTKTASGEGIPKELKIDYLKSSQFRTIRVDGVFGGLTPRGTIWATLWTERGAIPTQIVHEVGPDGALGKEVLSRRVTRDAVVREAEVVAVLDIATAKSLANWLTNKIKEFEKLTGKPAEASKGGE